jgi:hypothetical protein
MYAQRCTLALLSIAVNCWINAPIAFSQNLTDQWVEKAARPLVEKRVVTELCTWEVRTGPGNVPTTRLFTRSDR